MYPMMLVTRAVITACQIHDGVMLHFYPSRSDPVKVTIGITSAQDLICDLGSPLRVYQKEDDRMAIHATTRPTEGEESGCERVNTS